MTDTMPIARARLSSFVSVFVLALAAGCGGGTSNSNEPSPSATAAQGPANGGAPAQSGDGSQTPSPPLDHGAPSTTYPAFTPDMPQVVDNGGKTLSSPVIFTVTFPGDPNADTFEQFATAIGPSKYWNQITSEYGIGAATSPADHHIRMPQALGAKVLSDDLVKIITDNVDSQTSGWPAYSAETIYTLFVPATTLVYDVMTDPDLCSQGAGGYHDEVTSPGGKDVIYAVILMCPTFGAGDGTLSASHEWAEASTDPHAQTTPAYVGLDDAHFAYDLFVQYQDETGDMCEFDEDQELASMPDLPFMVQRQWSNKSAKAGHATCVPSAVPAYWNVTALDAPTDKVTYDLTAIDPSYGAVEGSGYKLAVGDQMTIGFGVYSDGATDAIALDAVEFDMDSMGNMNPVSGGKNVTLTLDKTSATNGEKTYLTIKRTAKPVTDSHLVVVSSTVGKTVHYMPIIVGDADAASKVMQNTGPGPTMRKGHGRVLKTRRAPFRRP
jgi:hypothetical protein